jgi:hypothetical protein
MDRELRRSAIFRNWRTKFDRGELSAQTDPGFGGIDAQYDELGCWLDEHIKSLDPLPSLYTATFRALPGQEELPGRVFRELEVAWTPATA